MIFKMSNVFDKNVAFKSVYLKSCRVCLRSGGWLEHDAFRVEVVAWFWAKRTLCHGSTSKGSGELCFAARQRSWNSRSVDFHGWGGKEKRAPKFGRWSSASQKARAGTGWATQCIRVWGRMHLLQKIARLGTSWTPRHVTCARVFFQMFSRKSRRGSSCRSLALVTARTHGEESRKVKRFL